MNTQTTEQAIAQQRAAALELGYIVSDSVVSVARRRVQTAAALSHDRYASLDLSAYSTRKQVEATDFLVENGFGVMRLSKLYPGHYLIDLAR